MEDVAGNIEDTRDDLKSLMAQCYLSTKVTSKVIFPDRFYLPFSKLHDQIFDILDKGKSQKVLILAPRGFGKTSIMNLAYPAKNILFQDKKFIVPISATATQAEMQSENMKRELLTNSLITKMFQPVKSANFSKEMWITSTGTAVLPRGSGQQVRGILYGDNRPDLIICDDLENAESVKSEEQRKKTKDWFFDDVCNSINRASKDWRIIVIGTLLHEDSLLANLADDPDWDTITLSICDESYKSNWPDFISDEGVLKLVENYRLHGMLDNFCREYMNKPISTETARFKQENFRQYTETDATFPDIRKKLENLVLFDPAKTLKPESADSAIVGVGIDLATPAIYVRDIVYGKFYPDQLYDEAFKMADKIGARVIGIEVTSLNEFIMYPIRTEMVKRGKFYELVELKARASKEERIAGLVPFYRMGYVLHNTACCAPLELQLISYPRSKRWDIMDALAYVVEMLDAGDRYFLPSEKDEDAIEVEKEYEELEAMEPMSGWRCA